MPDRIADLMAWGLSEGVARRVASRDRPVGPVRDQRSEAARLEALLATRDRLAQQTPTERLIAGMDPTLAGPRRSAAPTATLASLADTGARMNATPPPGKWDQFTGSLAELLNASTGTARGDVMPLVGFAAQPASENVQRFKESLLSRLPADTGDRSTFLTSPSVMDSSPLQTRLRNEAGHITRAAADTVRLAAGFVPDTNLDVATFGTAKLLGAAAPVFMGAGKLAKVVKEAQAARALTGGFYSRVDEAAKFLPAKGVKAESLMNTLKKASGGVSAEELELRGLAEFAASKRGQVVTPADLAAHLKANPAPFPKVKTLGVDKRKMATYRLRDKPNEPTFMATGSRVAEFDANPRYERVKDLEPVYPTKFSQYQVPGGENYRETLLTLPVKTGKQGRYKVEIMSQGGGSSWRSDANAPITADELAELRARYEPDGYRVNFEEVDTPITDAQFGSSHFDDPNIVAHTRSNERTSPTGERGTFLEEVQSDWHQQGKEKGYQTGPPRLSAEEAARAWVQDAGVAWETLTRAQQASNIRMAQTNAEVMYAKAVPDAPFKENWPDLSLKQALIDEANRSPDPGFLGFTGGKTQAARYDLSKQVGKVEADLYDIAGDNNWRLRAWDLDGNHLPISNQYLTDTELADHIGKDMARKIIGDKGGVYTGLDLQVGGEGMHEFYDKLLPKRLEKIVKPFGGTVESGAISHRQAVPSRPDDLEYMRGFANSGGLTTQQTPMWLSRLTPEMKARILKEGLPLMGLSGVTLGSLLGAEKQQAR